MVGNVLSPSDQTGTTGQSSLLTLSHADHLQVPEGVRGIPQAVPAADVTS